MKLTSAKTITPVLAMAVFLLTAVSLQADCDSKSCKSESGAKKGQKAEKCSKMMQKCSKKMPKFTKKMAKCSKKMDKCAEKAKKCKKKYSEKKSKHSLPLIGDKAPSFDAVTTEGKISFPEDYKGDWVILFSHPADFTPVCTTEFMTFASMQDQFNELNCKLIGLSIDSKYSHIAWLRTIKEKINWNGMKDVEVEFPVIADITMDVAKKFGMVQPNVSKRHAVRAVYFIDPQAKIRAILYYPKSTGRNFKEIKRLLIALQTTQSNNVATPADWQPGEDVIVPPPGSCGTAEKRVENAEKENLNCVDWFMCFKEMPKKKLDLPKAE